MSKPLVIYHANCADGFGAAFAAWMKLGDEAEYLPAGYGDIGHSQLSDQFGQHRIVTKKGEMYWIDNREVYILDFSLSREMMDYLFKYASRVVWLDHHKTAFEMWCSEYQKGMRFDDIAHGILLDDNKSGALLAWEYFHPGAEVPMLIRHIDDNDRWQFKLEGTKAFNKALWSLV